MEPKLILVTDDKKQAWMLNLAHVVAFGPIDDFKRTYLQLVTGASIAANEPITYFIPNFPMPKPALILPTATETAKVVEAQDAPKPA